MEIPSGPKILQPSLLRGDGLLIVRGGLHTSLFRQPTVEKLLISESKGQVVYVPIPAETAIEGSPRLGQRMGAL